jgi:hypothetical protein
MCRKFRCVLRMVHGVITTSHLNHLTVLRRRGLNCMNHGQHRQKHITRNSRTRRALRPESGSHTNLAADREDCLRTWRRCHSYRYIMAPLISVVSCLRQRHVLSIGFVLVISPPPLLKHTRIPRTTAPLGDSCRPQCVFKNRFPNKRPINHSL